MKGGEKMLTKKIMIPLFAVAISGATLFGVSQFAMAQGQTTPSLVTMIAQKFSLEQSQVQSVFDQYKSQHQADMQTREKTRLGTLVQQGKITQAQEQSIIDEMVKLKSEYNPSSFKGMTSAQRKDAFTKEQEEITAWAKNTGISTSYLMPRFGTRGGHKLKLTTTTTP